MGSRTTTHKGVCVCATPQFSTVSEIYMVFCVGMDTRCQHSDEAACQELMDWGVPCHFSESGRLDEQLSTSVCSPL